MTLKLMYITNNPEVAIIAQSAGVDWIFLDLEIIGKALRQGHLDTVISNHTIEDIPIIKKCLSKAKLLVRVNPIHQSSAEEIDKVIAAGADIIMLPFFKTKEEVTTFINQVNARAETCLLCETPEAVAKIDEIIGIPGIDYIHIGLNDLHLGYSMKFMFEPLANGTVDILAEKFKKKGVAFGFGGIAQLGQGTLPAEMILAEHKRLGSEMAILSRSFCNTAKIANKAKILEVFSEGVAKIRAYEKLLQGKSQEFFAENKRMVAEKVNKIVNPIL